MANWYVGSVGWTAVTAWAASTTYAVGNIRRQLATPTAGNERVWRASAITTGVSGSSEPAWTLTKGSNTTDSGVTWTEITGQESFQTAGAWTAPHARIENACASGWAVAGDNIYVASNHAQTQAGAVTVTSPGTSASPCTIVCIDETGTGHVPPSVAGDLKTTATVSTTGANAIAFDGGVSYVYGLTLNGGDSTNSGQIQIASMIGSAQMWVNCNLVRRGTGGSSSAFVFGAGISGADCKLTFNNVVLTFGNTSDQINCRTVRFLWKNTATALGGSTFPTNMFSDAGGISAGTITCEGVDLSGMGSGKTIMPVFQIPRDIILKDCKLNSSVTIASTPTKPGYVETYVTRSDSASANYRQEKYSYTGTQTSETVVIRTSGASDNTTGFSQKIATTANSKWILPFEALPIVIWNQTTASNVTVTVEGIYSSTVVPNNDDIFIDVEYLGSSATPQGSFASSSKSNIVAANAALTASTKAWDGQATARQNSHAYSLGDIYKSANNAGRLFIVTTAGTSAGSEPGGIATAVDGGSVTDGTAVVRAMVRFIMAVTLSSPQPNMIGYLYAYVKVAKASTTYYVDPLITLS